MTTLLSQQLQSDLKTNGFCVVPNVLTKGEVKIARQTLVAAADVLKSRGMSTHTESIDPNPQNVRIYNLPQISPLFAELLHHPMAIALAQQVLGPFLLVSNFTANIALPGSKSMRLHSDQALVIPPPWLHAWTMNVIWCLDDVHEVNGATRYLPGSNRYLSFDDVPKNAERKTLPFEAAAGSVIAMEGRLWHTSGANVSSSEERAMMFAFYSVDFIRPQINWEVTLSDATKKAFDQPLRHLMGLGATGNVRLGGQLTRLEAENAT